MSTRRDKTPSAAESLGCADYASIDRIAAYYAPDADAAFPQPFWELLLSLAVAFIPVAIVVWGLSDGDKS